MGGLQAVMAALPAWPGVALLAKHDCDSLAAWTAAAAAAAAARRVAYLVNSHTLPVG